MLEEPQTHIHHPSMTAGNNRFHELIGLIAAPSSHPTQGRPLIVDAMKLHDIWVVLRSTISAATGRL